MPLVYDIGSLPGVPQAGSRELPTPASTSVQGACTVPPLHTRLCSRQTNREDGGRALSCRSSLSDGRGRLEEAAPVRGGGRSPGRATGGAGVLGRGPRATQTQGGGRQQCPAAQRKVVLSPMGKARKAGRPWSAAGRPLS